MCSLCQWKRSDPPLYATNYRRNLFDRCGNNPAIRQPYNPTSECWMGEINAPHGLDNRRDPEGLVESDRAECSRHSVRGSGHGFALLLDGGPELMAHNSDHRVFCHCSVGHASLVPISGQRSRPSARNRKTGRTASRSVSIPCPQTMRGRKDVATNTRLDVAYSALRVLVEVRIESMAVMATPPL